MFLESGNVVYYHPLDDLVEQTKAHTWTGWFSSDFVPGVINSGITSVPSTGAMRIFSTTPYDSFIGSSGIACAFWASGFLGGDTEGRSVKIGHAGGGSQDTRDALMLEKVAGSSDNFITLSIVGFTLRSRTWTSPPDNNTDWNFFVLHFEYESSGWRHRVSVNGSGWADLGVDTNGTGFIYSNAGIEIDDDPSSPKIPLDEVILWKDNDLFTDQELSNLYELANTFNSTMDQYTDTFGTPANSGADLFIHGNTQESGNFSLYIPGQKEAKSASLFMFGFDPNFSDDMTLFEEGHQSTSGNFDQYITGLDVSSGNATLYTLGAPLITSSGDLYIKGPLLASGNITQTMTGHETVSGNFSLFMQGREPDFSAFVGVVDNNPSGTASLFAHGVPFGESTTFYTNDTATLFIKDTGEDRAANSSWSSFVRTEDPILSGFSGTWSSFVRVGNTVNDNIGLYINSHASGENPRGILVSGSFGMFVEGLSTSAGDESLLDNGYFADSLESSAFTKVHLGLSGSTSFYVSGSIAVVPPSATLDLSIFGVLGMPSNSGNLFIPGLDSVNDNYSLFIFGIQGLPSGNAPLYIQVTDIGSLTQETSLYSHGF